MIATALVKAVKLNDGLQLKTAGSNVLFAAVTEISDSVLRGAETSGFDGLVQTLMLYLCI